MAKRFSLSIKLVLAFLSVSLLTLLLVLVLLERATTNSFQSYVAHSQAMERMMPDSESMMGPDEQTFLDRLRLWLLLGGLGGGALATVLGMIVASRITSPLRKIGEAANAVARGDRMRRAPVTGSDELGDLAKSFNRMAETLASQEATRQQLFADIAHELRTPLAVLQAEIEALQDGVTEPNPERLASLHEETVLLNRLVEDLRTLSLADEGALKLEFGVTDSESTLRRAVTAMSEAAVKASVHLALQLEPSLPPVLADGDRIVQVVTNLCSNAIRHTPAGGEVAVRARAEHGQLCVEVQDSGSGIPPESLPYLFDRFFRIDASRTRSRGGTGLGLAIAQQLVRAHGGEIWAANNDGTGATVGFTLPLAGAAAGPQVSHPDRRADAPGSIGASVEHEPEMPKVAH